VTWVEKEAAISNDQLSILRIGSCERCLIGGGTTRSLLSAGKRSGGGVRVRSSSVAILATEYGMGWRREFVQLKENFR